MIFFSLACKGYLSDSMDRGLWMVVGKVSGLMIIAGLIGVAKSDLFTTGIALLGVVTYGLAMYNILLYDEGPADNEIHEAESRSADRRGL